jgi:hypothetical protein
LITLTTTSTPGSGAIETTGVFQRKYLMTGKQCKLYDENLVRNIMISTGLSIIEYIKQCKVVDTLDVCDYIEQNANTIISNTIADMNQEPPDDISQFRPPREDADLGLENKGS